MTNQSVINRKLKNPLADLILVAKNFFKTFTKESEYSSFFQNVGCKSQFIYAYALLNGNTYKGVKKGSRYLKRVALKKDEDGILLLARNYYYGYGVKKNDQKAFKLWGKGAKLGNGESAYYFGLCFAKGIGVKQNLVKAEKFLQLALSKGFDLAKTAISDLKYYNDKV